MKRLVTFLLLCISTTVSAYKDEPTKPPEPEVKHVCIIVYDAKEKKDVEKCRVIKIYKPHDATPIPKR